MAAKSKSAPAPYAGVKKKINFSLQCGGSHGAFGWGVMDKFLEDGRI